MSISPNPIITQQEQSFVFDFADFELCADLIVGADSDQSAALIAEYFAQARRVANVLSACFLAMDQNAHHQDQNGNVAFREDIATAWWFYRDNWLKNTRWEDARGSGLLLQEHVMLANEMVLSSNPALVTIAGFTRTALNLVTEHGSEAQKEVLLSRLKSFDWDACLCMTEENAGSDLTRIRAQATCIQDDIYSVVGEKNSSRLDHIISLKTQSMWFLPKP